MEQWRPDSGLFKKREEKPKEGHPFFVDRTRELALGDGPFVETPTIRDNTLTLLTYLTRSPKARVMINGEQGSGRYTLLRSIALASVQNTFPGLEKKKIIEIDGQSLIKETQQDKANRLPELLASMKDSFFYIDLSGLSDQELAFVSRLKWSVPLMVIGSPRAFKNKDLWVDQWDDVSIKPYTTGEVKQIIEGHYGYILQKNNLTGGNEKEIIDLLLTYAEGVTQKSQPGAGLELLRLTAAAIKLSGSDVLDANQVAQFMARQGHVSPDTLLKGENEKILDLEKAFSERIINQEEAKERILAALRRKAAALSEDKRPIGSFIFLGPTGVGKTETARVLAETLFGSQKNMIQIDMSEYQEPHSISRLIGSPPGYVGYDAGGHLTEAVRRDSFSVVLLDEFDKANSNVYDVLLQVLEDGRLTDGKGRTVDFRQTIIIMTSNFMSEYFYQGMKQGVDPDQVSREILENFKTSMRPELINRIDGIVVYKPLTKEDSRQVLDLMIENMVQRQLKSERDIDVEVTTELRQYLLDQGFDQKLGARPLKRMVEQLILDNVAAKIISGEVQNGDKLFLSLKGEEIVVTKA